MSPVIRRRTRRRTPSEGTNLVPGPWSHREVSAGGIRFHVAEAGDGPLVLLLHGFPQNWWVWRHQIPALAEAGFHVVAPDLRGYGGTDKPPRGYDLPTLAADAAGLVRALGHSEAVVVGHDWGGAIAWTMAAVHPEVVRSLVVTGIAHPRLMRSALLRSSAQRRASAYMLPFQVPRLGERKILRHDAQHVAHLLHSWSGPDWPATPDFAEAERRYRDAARLPAVAHSALEYYRWVVRSLLRPDGRRYQRSLRDPVAVPVLQLHGELDPCILPETAVGLSAYVRGDVEAHLLEGVGHFVPEEAPVEFTGHLLRWLDNPP